MNEDEYIKKLKNIEELVDENNDILTGMRNGNRFSKLTKMLYWIIIIISGLYLWSILAPILDQFSTAVDSISETKDQITDSVSGLKNSLDTVKESTSGITDFLDKFKK